MRTTVLCHPDEIAAGLDFSALHARGLGGLTVNVLYHDWVCWTPLSKEFPLRRELGGASAVRVGAGHPIALKPAERSSRLADVAKARTAGMALDAWTVSLHRDDLARSAEAAHLVPIDAFGTRMTTWVCPSSDAARDYLVAHVGDIARTGDFQRVLVEGCHYPELQHGGAHERDLSRIDGDIWRLLEVCFCDACRNRLAAKGHDPAGWRADVRAGAYGDARKLIDDPRMHDTIALRHQRVAELFTAMHAAAPQLALSFADAPAITGETFRTGIRLNEDPGPLYDAVGFDIQAILKAGANIVCLAYFRSPQDVEQHLSFYLGAGVPPERLTVTFRPGAPDCTSADELMAKVRLALELGVTDIAFYELAQMQSPDWQRTMDAIARIAA